MLDLVLALSMAHDLTNLLMLVPIAIPMPRACSLASVPSTPCPPQTHGSSVKDHEVDRRNTGNCSFNSTDVACHTKPPVSPLQATRSLLYLSVTGNGSLSRPLKIALSTLHPIRGCSACGLPHCPLFVHFAPPVTAYDVIC